MTEAELVEMGLAHWSNAISIVGLTITLISGYLIVAYIVGAEMTRSQVITVNILYMGFAAFLILSMLAFTKAAGSYDAAAWAITTIERDPPRMILAYIYG